MRAQLCGRQSATEREKRREHFEILEAAVTYKIEWGQELEWRAQLGILGPEPLPHPDHVLIDARSGTVRIVGPVTKEEKAEWTKRKAEFEEEVRWLQRELAKSKGRAKQFTALDLERSKKRLSIYQQLLGRRV